MTQVPPSEIDSLVEAKLYDKGWVTAKQLAEWLKLPHDEVYQSLVRLKTARHADLDPTTTPSLWKIRTPKTKE